MSTFSLAQPKIVTRDEWLTLRKELLAKEKELTRKQDALSAERRRLPMVAIDKSYRFAGPEGQVSLLDLFNGRRQLIIYHFMFDPNDPPQGKQGDPWDEGCRGCSFVADNLPHLSHLQARDTTMVLVSRAPLSKIAPFKDRMGWTVPWYSSFGSDFNFDFRVTMDESVLPIVYNFQDKTTMESKGQFYHLQGEQPGLSVFLRTGDQVYHTYSAYGRGLESFLSTYHLLDLTPYGRQEDWEDSPEGWPQSPTYENGWLRHHDKYENPQQKSGSCCH